MTGEASVIPSNIGISGTKVWIKEKVVLEGISHPNTSIFILNKKSPLSEHFKNQLKVTIQIAIYHAISIYTQHSIRASEYATFREYYTSNPHDLPNILVIKDNLLTQDINSNFYRIKSNDQITYPYSKIKDIGNLPATSIKHIITITLEQFEKIENLLPFPLYNGEVTKGNYFEKSGNSNRCIEIVEMLLPEEVMETLTLYLSELIFNDVFTAVLSIYEP